ncbi:hypothetical protein FHW23_001190 [Curtobacterium pusillum]|uniref:Uncharacterized protein n=1 Tax=Curtobacterium pusillum TaxID=69373 RepID=A0AAW3T5J7_9MICO|nr:hypothetical protein [Curtobacterium pusillum]
MRSFLRVLLGPTLVGRLPGQPPLVVAAPWSVRGWRG